MAYLLHEKKSFYTIAILLLSQLEEKIIVTVKSWHFNGHEILGSYF